MSMSLPTLCYARLSIFPTVRQCCVSFGLILLFENSPWSRSSSDSASKCFFAEVLHCSRLVRTEDCCQRGCRCCSRTSAVPTLQPLC
jgi:hypothetical protein